MSEGRKKGFFGGMAFLQIIANVFCWFNVSDYAKDYLKILKADLESFGPKVAIELEKIFTLDFATNYVIFASGVCAMLGFALLMMANNGNILNRKGLAVFLLVMILLLTVNSLSTSLAVIGLVSVIMMKGEKKTKKKGESIEKLDELKVTKKDLLLSCLLLVVYFSQFLLDLFDSLSIFIVIGYYAITFGLTIYVFWNRYKRDFFFFWNSLGNYVKYVFKMWGLMLLASLGAAFIAMLLNGNTQSVNQETLNTMSIWFMLPMACVWAPIVEEAVFRGVIRRFIPNNDVLFVIVSSVLFGLIHTIGQEETIYLTIVQSLQYMAMGAVMAITYVKSNNIATNIGVHCLQNTFSTIIINLIKLF